MIFCHGIGFYPSYCPAHSTSCCITFPSAKQIPMLLHAIGHMVEISPVQEMENQVTMKAINPDLLQVQSSLFNIHSPLEFSFTNSWKFVDAMMVALWLLPLWSVQFSSVAQLCLTLCDLMGCSLPGFSVHHQLLELTQTHVHRVSEAFQPSHPLSSPSPPAFSAFNQASGSFPMSQFFTSGGQSIGVSASASVLPMNIQD